VTLARENCRHASIPRLFDGREDSQFIVYDYVVFGRITSFDIRELTLFVNIDQNVPVNLFQQT